MKNHFSSLIYEDTSIGGPGSLDNEKIKCCKICASNDFFHEPIIFKKVVVEKWIPFDYFKSWQQHRHKKKIAKDGENRI
jgi:hypothetical protein